MKLERVCAVLPLKPFDDAKERLATGLDPAARQVLARAMASDVLAALPKCERVAEIVVVSAQPDIAEIAAGASAVLPDARTGHSDAALLGVDWAVEHGCDAALLVPGDCPLLDPEEIDGLIERAESDGLEVTVVPDRMGTGTNALLLAPPAAMAPSFGPDSRERHLRSAGDAGRRAAAIEVRSLALDIDTSDDLLELAERLSIADHDAVNTEFTVAGLLADRYRLPGGLAR